MKLIDKFKNLFTEEVEEDVNIEIKDSKPKVEVIRETIKQEQTPVIPKKEDPIKAENMSLKKEEKFVFPVYFDEKDFDDMEKKEKSKPVTIKREEKKDNNFKETYNKKVSEVKKNFKPTPIISPVYGVLDKNYYKEDIVVTSSTRSSYPSDRPISIDDIRKKAFGTLEDDLENELFSNEEPRHAKIETKEDDTIFNEFDFANAIEEDKKRDLSKDNLKADIESLLNDKEFTNEFDFHKAEDNAEKNLEEEQVISDLSEVALEEDNTISNSTEEISEVVEDNNEDILLGSEELPMDKEVKINNSNDDEEENHDNNDDDITNGQIEMPNNTDNEIENAFADSSDLNESDLFNLIDSMYDKKDE